MHGIWLLVNWNLFSTISSSLSAHICRDIVLSDNKCHTSLGPFHVTAGTAVLTAIFFCYVLVNIMLYTVFKKGAESGFLQLPDMHHTQKHINCTSKFCWWNCKHYILNFPFRECFQCKDYYCTVHPINAPQVKISCMCSYVADKESQSPFYYSVTINTL